MCKEVGAVGASLNKTICRRTRNDDHRAELDVVVFRPAGRDSRAAEALGSGT
jgi:hypothetical protein